MHFIPVQWVNYCLLVLLMFFALCVKVDLHFQSQYANTTEFWTVLCRWDLKQGHGSLAIEHCTKSLELKENSNVRCARAEAYLLKDMYIQAINDYETVLKRDGARSRCALHGLKRVRIHQKSYYRILGVSKTANNQEIKKAFRKLALKVHPDHADEKDKTIAEAQFRIITKAMEVLTNPEKRRQYDKDPLVQQYEKVPYAQNENQRDGFEPEFFFYYNEYHEHDYGSGTSHYYTDRNGRYVFNEETKEFNYMDFKTGKQKKFVVEDNGVTGRMFVERGWLYDLKTIFEDCKKKSYEIMELVKLSTKTSSNFVHLQTISLMEYVKNKSLDVLSFFQENFPNYIMKYN